MILHCGIAANFFTPASGTILHTGGWFSACLWIKPDGNALSDDWIFAARVPCHYCRRLLSDLLLKCAEPIALAAGTAARTHQEFLVTSRWDQSRARDNLQGDLGGLLADHPAEPLGTVGVIDETDCRKWGDHTPRCRAAGITFRSTAISITNVARLGIQGRLSLTRSRFRLAGVG